MCGVLAEIAGNGLTVGWPGAALAALAHRGPDGAGKWIAPDRRVGLAHARLALVDLAGGAQPLSSEDGRVVAVVNGEFYGFEAIRRRLEREGHRFSTRSDSEILVHLYEARGLDALDELDGEFAFVLWDGASERLIAARDRFGVKPLVWSTVDGRVRVASEAKALHALGVPARWDVDAVRRAACHQYLPVDRTLFEGVRAVPPGHLLLVDRAGVSVRRWWELRYHEPGSDALGERDGVAAVASALEDAVLARRRGDVPVAVHLSGGLDSSAVAGILARHQPTTAYTVCFDDARWDESSIAAATAAAFGLAWRPVRVSPLALADALPEAVRCAEGTAINAHLPAKYLLSRAIRADGFRVALSGEGSDEVFTGYPHLRQDLWEAAGDVGAVARLAATNHVTHGIQLPAGPGLSVDGVARRLGFVPTFLRAKAGFGLRMTSLLDARERTLLAEDSFGDLLDGLPWAEGRAWHPADRAAWLWSKLALAGSILRTLGDGTEMAHGVEGRLPFLDRSLVDVARRLPITLRVRGGVEKWALREAVRPWVTDGVYTREKHPFMAPPIAAAGTATRALLEDVVRTAGALPPGVDAAAVRARLDGLDDLPPSEQVAWDAPLCVVLTGALLQRGLGLT